MQFTHCNQHVIGQYHYTASVNQTIVLVRRNNIMKSLLLGFYSKLAQTSQLYKNQGVKNFTLVARQDCCTLTVHGSHTLMKIAAR